MYLGGSTPQTTTDSELLQLEVEVLPDDERVRAKPLPPGRSLSVVVAVAVCSLLSLLLRDAGGADLTGAGGSSAASEEATREPRSATSRSRSSKRDEEKNGSSKKEAGRRRAEAMTSRREQSGFERGGSAVAAFVLASIISKEQNLCAGGAKRRVGEGQQRPGLEARRSFSL